MKYALAGSWLLLALPAIRSALPRRFFGYGGCILALVHLCALALGLLDRNLNRRPAEGGVPVGGFFTGIAVGLVLGVLLGGFVSRNTALYILAQLVTAGFLAFLPLFRI
jgi:hypothetical protein